MIAALLLTASALPTISIVFGLLVAVVCAGVLVYLYAFSSYRKGTTELQDQANLAQQQIIEAMQIEQAQLRKELDMLREQNTHQAEEISLLREQVTQAAKVDALRTQIEMRDKELEKMFGEIDSKLDDVLVRVGGEAS